MWADPENIAENERFIRYGKEYLEHTDAALFEKPKIIVGRVVNRDSIDPLGASLDTSGLWPDTNVFCLCPLEFTNKQICEATTPLGWNEINDDERLLWLLGILASETARELSFRRRESRYLVKKELKEFEIPSHVDSGIVAITRAMVARDQARRPISSPDPLRQELNRLVEASYGYPLMRNAGNAPAIESWKKERQSHPLIVTGQVLDFRPEDGRIMLALDGIEDDRSEGWVPLPSELPGWALDRQVFTAEISEDIHTFEELAQRPWALRGFKHTPRPYLTIDELKEEFALTSSS